MNFKKIIDFLKVDKGTLLTAIVIVVIAGIWTFFQDKELKDGVTVEGKIIECNMLRTNSECVVKVEFYTESGEKRISENTLYKVGNCLLGKKVKIRYSSRSDLTDVDEEGTY